MTAFLIMLGVVASMFVIEALLFEFDWSPWNPERRAREHLARWHKKNGEAS